MLKHHFVLLFMSNLFNIDVDCKKVVDVVDITQWC